MDAHNPRGAPPPPNATPLASKQASTSRGRATSPSDPATSARCALLPRRTHTVAAPKDSAFSRPSASISCARMHAFNERSRAVQCSTKSAPCAHRFRGDGRHVRCATHEVFSAGDLSGPQGNMLLTSIHRGRQLCKFKATAKFAKVHAPFLQVCWTESPQQSGGLLIANAANNCELNAT